MTNKTFYFLDTWAILLRYQNLSDMFLCVLIKKKVI